MTREVLFIFAHADDAELNSAFAIDKFSRTHKTKIIICSGPEDSKTHRVRMKEASKASKYLKVSECILLPFTENRLHENLGVLIQHLNNQINENTEYVFTHNPYSSHQDHTTVYKAALTLIRKIPNFITCEACTSTEISTSSFKPNLFLVGNIKRKLKALSFHKSQVKKYSPDWKEGIKGLAKFRALQFNMYAVNPGHVETYQNIKLKL